MNTTHILIFETTFGGVSVPGIYREDEDMTSLGIKRKFRTTTDQIIDLNYIDKENIKYKIEERKLFTGKITF